MSLDEMDFYKNDHSEIEYFHTCLKCQRDCKQSAKCLQLFCTNYIKNYSNDTYKKKRISLGYTISDLAKKSGIHSRTIKKYENKPDFIIPYEHHQKLIKALFKKSD